MGAQRGLNMPSGMARRIPAREYLYPCMPNRKIHGYFVLKARFSCLRPDERRAKLQ
jgi:hypothetical protein